MSLKLQLDEIQNKRGVLTKKCQDLVSTAKSEGRDDLNAEESAVFDKCHEEERALAKQRDRLEYLLKRESEDSEIRSHGLDLNTNPASAVGDLSRGDKRKGGKLDAEQRADIFNAWARASVGAEPTRKQQRAIQAAKSLDKRFSMPRKEFEHGRFDNRSVAELQKRDVGISAGAGLIAQGFLNEFFQEILFYCPIAQYANIFTTADGSPMKMGTMDDTGNTGVLLSEATTFGASVDPTISSVTFGAYKFSSKPVFASYEMVRDSAFDLGTHIKKMQAERIGRVLNTYATNGTGSSQPQGVAYAANGSTETSLTYAISSTDLFDLYHAVDAGYRIGAKWMMHDRTVKAIRKLRDTTNQFLWQPGLQAGTPDSLMGHPVVVNNDLATLSNANDTSFSQGDKVALFGDFSKVYLRLAEGLRTRFLEERYADTDQVAWISYQAMDSKLLSASAVKGLVIN